MALSSLNASHLLPSFSSSNGAYNFFHNCFNSTAGTFSITAFTVTNSLVMLPLCILVLYFGYQQWQQQRLNTALSHSDLFTYHMIIIELTNMLGSTVTCYGVHTDRPKLMILGIYLFPINLSGQMMFHILTCVERYLAVVHPVTYLGLRKPNGIRIRNVSIGCVWLLCLAGIGSVALADHNSAITLSLCVVAFSLIVITFCSISVLCALNSPGPGEGIGDRQRVDQSKLRAFYTIMAIMGVLLLRSGGNMFTSALFDVPHVGENERCHMWVSVVWFSLPSSLVLPLLFLQRAGKLPYCKTNTKSGQ